jgi:hypothetical protein
MYRRKNDRFLEQRINTKFCVKLGRNPNDTSNAYGVEDIKKGAVFLSVMNDSNRARHVEITNANSANRFLQYQGHCSL